MSLLSGQASSQEVAKERQEMLVTELLGELVKVRGLGYKTMRRARVDAGYSDRHGGYMPYFRYEEEDRGQAIQTIKRLDVMTPDGWATVWDDGMDDLMPEDREKPATSAKPTGRKYKSGMLG